MISNESADDGLRPRSDFGFRISDLVIEFSRYAAKPKILSACCRLILSLSKGCRLSADSFRNPKSEIRNLKSQGAPATPFAERQ